MVRVTASATVPETADRRLMLVHAHPDDESINNGVTMAKYVAEGVAVCLVTCTLGEEGEVLVEELGHLAADQQDDLGQHRLGELKQAMDILGVTDFVRLGGDGRFRDSGMAWDARGFATARDELRQDTFWAADLLEATNELVPLIRHRQPQVLITQNEIGGYGHPDHIQAHRVSMYGSLLAGVPGYRPDLGPAWTVPRVLWTTASRSEAMEAVRLLRESGDMETMKYFEPDGPLASLLSDDEEIVAVIADSRYVGKKLEAMRVHATQIQPDGPFFAGLDVVGEQRWGREHYRLAAGQPFPTSNGWADDLFAGLT
jgi:N-acetyl-1-D-myo-inositol-2-amino-2-deoxy-alpha-D-glucopyranoside deacetylase